MTSVTCVKVVYCSWRVDTPQDIPTPIRVVLWTHQRTYPCQLRGGQRHTHHQDPHRMERETNAQLVRERSKYWLEVKVHLARVAQHRDIRARPRHIGRMRYDSKILHLPTNLSEAKGRLFTTLAELGVTLKRFRSPLHCSHPEPTSGETMQCVGASHLASNNPPALFHSPSILTHHHGHNTTASGSIIISHCQPMGCPTVSSTEIIPPGSVE